VKWILVALVVSTLGGAGVAFASSLGVASSHVTVFKNTLQPTTTTTSLPVPSITAGSSAQASASLSWSATVAPGGSVTYTVYTDSGCATLFATAGTVSVSAGIVPDSPLVLFNTAGNYYWKAAYSGDGYNQPSFDCLATPLVVN